MILVMVNKKERNYILDRITDVGYLGIDFHKIKEMTEDLKDINDEN